ncbi:DUF305 domain-containing protein [Kallotenue papyrolyticum]|uniref:DUF305 domain-containing protein n=1 Tax=Kallotenue papyrolyticum TaxID=1325125 RepID=UPI00047865EE|nr:DUF305 domain-containing protein [Kallotenue papyrolyticum]
MNAFKVWRALLSALLLLIVLSACGAARTTTSQASASPQALMSPGMDHNRMMAAEDAPFDARFIDSMIMHHQGAIAMARQAQQQAEHAELKQLADQIIAAQQAEIEQMQQWRRQWYPDLAPTMGMGMPMGDMHIGGDSSQPFDLRFIDSMIMHHQGAIAMARQAQQQAEHQELKRLADQIIAAQQAEIEQMQQWRQQWYGQ